MHRFDIHASRDRVREAEEAVVVQRRLLATAVGEETIRAERNLAQLMELHDIQSKTHALLLGRQTALRWIASHDVVLLGGGLIAGIGAV